MSRHPLGGALRASEEPPRAAFHAGVERLWPTAFLRLMGALASGGPEMARAVFAGDPMASFLALTEAVELGGILPFLKACKPETVRRKLLEVLQGPAQVTAGDQNTNQGRNILFEFNVAAKLCDAKLSPQLGDHPDVSCSVDGREIFIECKRH